MSEGASEQEVAEHVERCEQAGCLHPPFYDLGDAEIILGWCKLRRTEAFGEEAAEQVEERLEFSYETKADIDKLPETDEKSDV
jgi:hypothetical protein